MHTPSTFLTTYLDNTPRTPMTPAPVQTLPLGEQRVSAVVPASQVGALLSDLRKSGASVLSSPVGAGYQVTWSHR